MIGIYKIKNYINGKIYIGQSWNIEKRWREHRSNDNNSHNYHLYNAFKKYGIENFSFDVLKEFEKTSYPGILLQKHLDRLEVMYIKYYESINHDKGYNKETGGSNGKPSEETKKKISEARKGKNCGEKHFMFGKHIPEETKHKMSVSMSGENNHNSKQIKCIETGKIYISQTQASKELNIKNISLVCLGKRKSAGKLHFEFYNESSI